MLRLRIPRGYAQKMYVAYIDTMVDNWGKKAIRRRAPGTGRMRYLKDIPRKYLVRTNVCRLKNGFREFTQAKCVKQRGKGKNKPEVKETK